MPTSDNEFPPDVGERLNQARLSRVAVRANDPELFLAVSSAMFKHDLIGINFDDNTDEYDAEAGTVIPRLASCSSVEDVACVLHEEFLAWFGAETAGEVMAYHALANEIWQIKRSRRTSQVANPK
ncbi:hypothetical protein D9M69_577210 [compost metagenome]